MAIHQAKLPDDERVDFEQLARQYGKDPAKFKVEVMEDIPEQPGVVYRNVDLTLGETKVSYDGGHGTNWLGKFAIDLQAGVFG